MAIEHKRLCGCGFTLIEVVAGVFLLSLMLATVTVAFHRTVESVIDRTFEERAGAVAQRRLELLIASRQEPNTIHLRGRDEFDPVFRWEITLSREAVGNKPPRDDLSNTVIKAVVKVTAVKQGGNDGLDVQMTRYFASLLPLPGSDVAVPLIPEQKEAQWYVELRDRLGREPTMEETLQEMVKVLDFPADLLSLDADDDEDDDVEDIEDFDDGDDANMDEVPR